jgi:hypothetical protein
MVPEAVLPPPSIPRDRDASDPEPVKTRERVFGVAESWVAACALAAVIALRIAYALVYRVDSDEPQHLHVVWCWTQGMVQYRDFFDNHSPLFQMACAPLLRLLGEHVWIMIPMRLAMLPLYLADLWIVYLIGRALYFPRWGVWMALVAACVPKFFLITTEFRTDDLWTTLWLAAVWLAVAGPMTGKRAFMFGLTMGACFAVSMKTALLLTALGVGAAGLLSLHALSRRRSGVAGMLKTGGLILAGIVIIPALLTGFFAANGALHQMVYCVLEHNTLPGLGKWAKPGFHLWLFPLSLPVMMGLGWLCMHSSASERIGGGRAIILMTCCAYYFLLRSYWPLVTAQDFSPMLPLATLAALPFLFHLLSLAGKPAAVLIPAASLLLMGGETARIWGRQSPLKNEMAPFEKNLAIILHLTDPGDLVMDAKGETIFRPRPEYWVYEGVTLKRMQMGLIPDDVRERMIKTGTCVAYDHRMRPADRHWLHENFLEGAGKVWVAGKSLGAAAPVMTFHTEIRGRYSIVAQSGKLAGSLDGAPLRDSQEIPAGDHRLALTDGQGKMVALVWAQALERGFIPRINWKVASTE